MYVFSAEKLKALRKQRKREDSQYTLQGLADMVGIHKQTLYNYESGRSEPPFSVWYSLLFVLDPDQRIDSLADWDWRREKDIEAKMPPETWERHFRTR